MSTQEIAVPVVTQATADQLEPIIGPAMHALGDQLVREGRMESVEAFWTLQDGALAIMRRLRPFGDLPGRRTGLLVGYANAGAGLTTTALASLARDNGCRIVVVLADPEATPFDSRIVALRDTLHGAADGEDRGFLLSSLARPEKRATARALRRGPVEHGACCRGRELFGVMVDV